MRRNLKPAATTTETEATETTGGTAGNRQRGQLRKGAHQSDCAPFFVLHVRCQTDRLHRRNDAAGLMSSLNRAYRKRRKTTDPSQPASRQTSWHAPEFEQTVDTSDGSRAEYDRNGNPDRAVDGGFGNSLRAYLKDVGSVSVLNREQEFR